jgi:hypothetical protein
MRGENLETMPSLEEASLMMTKHFNMDEAWVFYKAIITFYL